VNPGFLVRQTRRLPVAETGEYLVMAPAHAGKPAQVLVYAVVPVH
jgi:hypothetical protein